MYFVVYLSEPQRYAVIPCMWVYDENDEMWERFMNNGLNSSQHYLCYWASANESEAFLGAPRNFYQPNFAAARATQFPCGEGTYVCRIMKFKGKYIEIVLFVFSAEY